MEKDMIRVTKRGDDGHRVISLRLKEETLRKIDEFAGKTNRSRNEIINILLDHGVELLKVEE